MKLEESETLRKQAKVALRESKEQFRLVAAEPKRDSLIPQGEAKTTSLAHNVQMVR